MDIDIYRFYKLKKPYNLNDFNDYFIKYVQTTDCKYVSSFLHYYESRLNSKALKFIKANELDIDRLQDLKQIFCKVLWEELQSYTAYNEIPFLQIIRHKVNRAWLEYLRQCCVVASFGSENRFIEIRRVMAAYSKTQYELTFDEAVMSISKQLSMPESKVKSLLTTALQSKYYYSYCIDSDDEDDTRNIIFDDEFDGENGCGLADLVESKSRYVKLYQAFATLTPIEKRIISLSFGYDFEKHIPIKQESYEKISLLVGLSNASSVEKKRKLILEKMKTNLTKSDYYFNDT